MTDPFLTPRNPWRSSLKHVMSRLTPVISPEELKNGKVGLVLCGGGFKGAYQIGAWKALKKLGIERFDVIAGTSVGALNAVLIANNDVEAAEKVWLKNDIMRLAPHMLVRYLIGYLLVLGPLPAALIMLLIAWLVPSAARPLVFDVSAVLSIIAFWVNCSVRFKTLDYKLFLFIDQYLLFAVAVVALNVCGYASLYNGRCPWMMLLGLPLGFLDARFGLEILCKAQRKGHLCSNTELITAVRQNLDLAVIKKNVGALFVTTARGGTYTDPFKPNIYYDYNRYQLRDTYQVDFKEPGLSTEWIPEYHDLCKYESVEQALEKLRLTSAFPFVFAAGKAQKNELIVDGGIIDNMPILPVLLHKVDSLIIICLDPVTEENWSELQSYVDERWKRRVLATLKGDIVSQVYRRWIKRWGEQSGGAEFGDMLPDRPLIRTRKVYVIAPRKPLAKLDIWPFHMLTGTLWPFVGARKKWMDQGYHENERGVFLLASGEQDQGT